jgi:hypothetical protein
MDPAGRQNTGVADHLGIATDKTSAACDKPSGTAALLLQ